MSIARILFPLVACAALLAAAPVATAQTAADSAPSVAEAQNDDSRPATLGDLRRLEDSLRAEMAADREAVKRDFRHLEDSLRAEFRTEMAADRKSAKEDSRHLENSLRAELSETRETIRWLILAMLAVIGLPQLSAWWERRRNGKTPATLSLALFCASVAVGAFAIVAAIAG